MRDKPAGNVVLVADSLKPTEQAAGELVANGEDAARMAAANPARILGLGRRGLLVPGYEADIVAFDEDFSVLACMVGGGFVKNEL
jgi:N-acetylglucosamine-6-phosphate deacetylase